jgi:hypothetical protein
MKEDGARRLALVRAIETADTAEVLLTRDDRFYATGAALAELEARSHQPRPQPSNDVFLERRSTLAYDRIAARYPAVAEADRRARWPGWVDWLLPAAALVLGFASNAVDGRRLSIIAFPMLGMLLWNLAVYALLAARTIRRLLPAQRSVRPGSLTRFVARFVGPAPAATTAQQPLANALGQYLRDWLSWSAPITNSRAARVLHISAAALAAGLLAGMYWRALGIEYRAGWESTLLGPQAVHALVHFMLWPASLVTGVELPDLARVEALRWGANNPGENAGRWLHLYAATALLFIVGPRIILAGWSALHVARLKANFPVPGREDFYVRRLLRSVSGGATLVRVIPYSFHPPGRTQRQLERLLSDVLGERTRMILEPSIAYGAEDDWLKQLDPREGEVDHVVVLFNLSATPEAENHGALVAGLRQRIAGAKSGAGLAVLLDESAMRRRAGAEADADARVESRRAAWETMLRQHHVVPLSLNLDADPASLARPLESALLHAHAGMPA